MGAHGGQPPRPHVYAHATYFDRKAGMRDSRIGGVGLGGILVILGIVLMILQRIAQPEFFKRKPTVAPAGSLSG